MALKCNKTSRKHAQKQLSNEPDLLLSVGIFLITLTWHCSIVQTTSTSGFSVNNLRASVPALFIQHFLHVITDLQKTACFCNIPVLTSDLWLCGQGCSELHNSGEMSPHVNKCPPETHDLLDVGFTSRYWVESGVELCFTLHSNSTRESEECFV